MRLWLERVRSPIGTILLVSDGAALRALDFADCEARMHLLLRRYCGAHTIDEVTRRSDLARRVQAYFDGDLDALADVLVRAEGTAFQQSVWRALREIPPGTTTTYGRLAASIGRPAAVRAVGHANGANPIAIVVPCHRVIGADQRLTGYAGGVRRKEWLLRHESRAS